jgi:hypothetical protein
MPEERQLMPWLTVQDYGDVITAPGARNLIVPTLQALQERMRPYYESGPVVGGLPLTGARTQAEGLLPIPPQYEELGVSPGVGEPRPDAAPAGSFVRKLYSGSR